MDGPNSEQAQFWDTDAFGEKWVTHEDVFDATLGPVLDLVMDRADLQPGERVLDIGCGTGASLLAGAARVGATGHVLGADISAGLLDRARQRAAQAGFAHVDAVLADAQTHAFDPADRDVMVSRFGVMFFEDSVAAFANIAKALRPGARMIFASWGDLAGNPYFRIPHIAATTRLGHPPRPDPHAPGPMAFQDIDRVTGLLQKAGLVDVACDPVTLALTPVGALHDVADYVGKVGPAVRVIQHFGGTEEDATAIVADIADRMAGFVADDGSVHIPALINLYSAQVAS